MVGQSLPTYLPHGHDDEEAGEADEEEEGHRPTERRLADVRTGAVRGARLLRRLPVHPEKIRPEATLLHAAAASTAVLLTHGDGGTTTTRRGYHEPGEPDRVRTAVCHAGAGDDAGLHHGVLLAGEGTVRHAHLAQQARPRLEEEEPQQGRRDVERRDDPRREHQVHHHAAERRAQREARRQGAPRHLLRPRRDRLHLERPLRRRALPRVADRLHPPASRRRIVLGASR